MPSVDPKPSEVDALLRRGPEASMSVGTPTEGHLAQSVALPLFGPGFVFRPDKDPARRFGTVELVQALVRAAARVDGTHPGGALRIGDLAHAKGGPVGGHASHRSGRDVDVLFFLLDQAGAPLPSKAIPLGLDGAGHDYGDLSRGDDDIPVQLDVARTWAFVAALADDRQAHVQRIFVAEHLRTLLLAHAEAIDAPTAVRTRVGHLACQPRFPHDDHMHIRVFCALDDIAAGCRDTHPVYPWHRAELKAHGTASVMAGRRTGARPKLTSVTEARDKAAAHVTLHPDVVAFLDARARWAKKPHPGRTYCR